MKRAWLFLSLIVVGCARPTLVGNWTVQDGDLAKKGVNSTIEYKETTYSMTTVMATPEGDDIRILTSGTYNLDGNTLMTTATDAKVDLSKLTPESRQKYSAQLTDESVLKAAQSNPKMELRFIGKDKAELTSDKGRSISLARTSIRL